MANWFCDRKNKHICFHEMLQGKKSHLFFLPKEMCHNKMGVCIQNSILYECVCVYFAYGICRRFNSLTQWLLLNTWSEPLVLLNHYKEPKFKKISTSKATVANGSKVLNYTSCSLKRETDQPRFCSSLLATWRHKIPLHCFLSVLTGMTYQGQGPAAPSQAGMLGAGGSQK